MLQTAMIRHMISGIFKIDGQESYTQHLVNFAFSAQVTNSLTYLLTYLLTYILTRKLTVSRWLTCQ